MQNRGSLELTSFMHMAHNDIHLWHEKMANEKEMCLYQRLQSVAAIVIDAFVAKWVRTFSFYWLMSIATKSGATDAWKLPAVERFFWRWTIFHWMTASKIGYIALHCKQTFFTVKFCVNFCVSLGIHGSRNIRTRTPCSHLHTPILNRFSVKKKNTLIHASITECTTMTVKKNLNGSHSSHNKVAKLYSARESANRAGTCANDHIHTAYVNNRNNRRIGRANSRNKRTPQKHC